MMNNYRVSFDFKLANLAFGSFGFSSNAGVGVGEEKKLLKKPNSL